MLKRMVSIKILVISIILSVILGIVLTFTILYNSFINANYTTNEMEGITILQVHILEQEFIFELYPTE